MDIRYTDPRVADRWSPEWTYNSWLRIETATLMEQRKIGIVPTEETDGLLAYLFSCHVGETSVGRIRAIERTTKHDVAAFLKWLRTTDPGYKPTPNGQWLHFGLTSSDLVDTTMGLRFKVLYGSMLNELTVLGRWLAMWSGDRTPVLGRTHGQPAEPTSMGTRAAHWNANMGHAIEALVQSVLNLQVCKLSGPVGTFAHNPPSVEAAVASELGLVGAGAGSSQISPRAGLALWASAVSSFAACCAKIATDVRIMHMLGEIDLTRTQGEVGSSAMPHKHNPIVAERICGLARMAQGYASMLQPLDLWLERDISHSCVERVAVPDLWHLLFTIAMQTTELLTSMHLTLITETNLEMGSNAAWSHKTTLDGIRDGMGYDEAREFGLAVDIESYDLMGDARWFTREVPE